MRRQLFILLALVLLFAFPKTTLAVNRFTEGAQKYYSLICARSWAIPFPHAFVCDLRVMLEDQEKKIAELEERLTKLESKVPPPPPPIPNPEPGLFEATLESQKNSANLIYGTVTANKYLKSCNFETSGGAIGVGGTGNVNGKSCTFGPTGTPQNNHVEVYVETYYSESKTLTKSF